MDNRRLILSVAGSGKTTLIIDSLELESRSLIITYTDNNYENLRLKVIQKFGYIPENIVIMTYFKFLYSFCYQPFLKLKVNANGYTFNKPPAFTNRLRRTNMKFYLNNDMYLYHNRVAKLIDVKGVIPYVKDRLEKYFDNLFVDEVQDFGGHDFNLLMSICQINIDVTFVGDYYQHTFDTSRDGNVNSALHNSYENYIQKFQDNNFTVDRELLSKSYRCSESICNFITQEVGITIQSHNDIKSAVYLQEDTDEIEMIVRNDNIIKLFYQNASKYNCYSLNWGASKGQDCHENVCVVLNQITYKNLKKNQLDQMNEKTKSKFYVACTRARNELIFIPEKQLTRYKII